MKKKFFTLFAAAAALGMGGNAYAQTAHADNGEIPYHSTIVKSASLDDFFWKVDQFVDGEYYQLVVNSDVTQVGVVGKISVLTQERDYSTGKLYLAVKPIQEATMNNSLWKIAPSASTDVNGRAYTFVNKETGVALSVDDQEAIMWNQVQAGDISSTVDIHDLRKLPAGFDSERLKGSVYSPSVVHGGINTWTWYTNYSNPTGIPFEQKVVWSYFHEKRDSVVGLALVGINDRTTGFSGTWDGSSKDRADRGRSYLVAVKGSQQELADLTNGTTANINGVTSGIDFVTLQPVRAGAKVLNADEINSMIDADGSFLSFTNDERYSPQYVYAQSKDTLKVSFKTVPTNFADNVLLGNTFKAKESVYKSLVRTQYDPGVATIVKSASATSIYAGYNILLNLQDSKKYLRVTEYPYDENNSSLTNDLKVRIDTLPTNWSKAAVVTAEDARYHWKVTYYATNDSLVFEPLNASRMSTVEVKSKKTFPESKAAAAIPEQFFNTINKGIAYDIAGSVDAPQANAYFNKAYNVPVALYALNNSLTGDADLLLTVGVPGNVNQDVQTSGAVTKFNASGLDYNSIEYNEAALHKPKEQKLNNYTVAGNNPAYVTNVSGNEYIAQQHFKLSFDRQYTQLKRATIKDGLYFLNLKATSATTLNRRNGSYLAYNLYGDLMYDSPGEYQDFGNMPAAQFVVEQLACTINDKTPEVSIRNREYGANHEVFRGQLYEDGNGNVFVLNHRDYYLHNIATGVNKTGMFDTNRLSCLDTLAFTEVSKTVYPEAYKDTHGYKRFDNEALRYETWAIRYNFATTAGAPDLDKYLSYDSKKDQLAIHNTMYPDFEVDTVAGLKDFGYAGAGLPQLQRQAYVLKVRDNNLIDNNWKYLVLKRDHINQLPYYTAVHLKDVDGVEIKLAKFYFKADQITAVGDPAYAFIDVNQNMDNKDLKKEGWLTYNDDLTNVNPEDAISSYFEYLGRTFDGNGFRRLSILDSHATSRAEDLYTVPSTNLSAFVFVNDPRPLYKPLNLAKGNKNVNLYENLNGAGATGKQYLFENGFNQGGNIPEGSYLKKFGYLGITSEKTIQPVNGTTALYADSVITSSHRMPQYLFFVDQDSVKDGRWCTTNVHGYFPTLSSADDNDKSHHEFYNGYVAGRALVNLNDSVYRYQSINKLDSAHLFKYDNYVRLAFVEAIHTYVSDKETAAGANEQLFKEEAGEYLYILTGIKLAELKATVGNDKNVIDPVKFKNALDKGLIQKNVLDGLHKNYAFSLRYTDDAHKDFLIESNDIDKNAGIGSFMGGWVKIHNGVPVLAQTSTKNGQHGNIGSTATLAELVNQARIFNVEDTNEKATSNDDVNVSDVKVVAGNGNIIITNAAGKTVAISNILGQTIANQVITSNNVTIAAPKGIVVVAVQGEEAVKAIVK